MTGIATVYTVFADEEEARRIARIVVDERLAACVNILARCHSIYRWQGKIEEADESPAVFKTADPRALIARLKVLHPYDVPALVAWPIAEANPDYAQWIADECRRG